ncbi:hypothetical protein T190_28495 [Sinorhizobium meliloti CCBAU 01290]|nr:hypothetical protein T190_28495 [Sinorhizobium meliloti CCBAU 01290]
MDNVNRLWIITAEGAAFAIAARDMNEEAPMETAAVLGKAISNAMLEVFDGMPGECFPISRCSIDQGITV